MAEQERSYSTISSSTTDLGSNRNKVITKKTTTVTPYDINSGVIPPPGTQEEWTTTKRRINHKTKQVETRVQRQIIMEDGKVIADSGPQVTTKTTEDQKSDETEDTKHRLLGDSEVPKKYRKDIGNQVVAEKTVTHNVTKEAKEENYQYHDESLRELDGPEIHRKAVEEPHKLISLEHEMPAIPRGKLVHFSAKGRKTNDRDEILEISRLDKDGMLNTETTQTQYHEEFEDDEVPEDGHMLENGSTQRHRELEYGGGEDNYRNSSRTNSSLSMSRNDKIKNVKKTKDQFSKRYEQTTSGGEIGDSDIVETSEVYRLSDRIRSLKSENKKNTTGSKTSLRGSSTGIGRQTVRKDDASTQASLSDLSDNDERQHRYSAKHLHGSHDRKFGSTSSRRSSFQHDHQHTHHDECYDSVNKQHSTKGKKHQHQYYYGTDPLDSKNNSNGDGEKGFISATVKTSKFAMENDRVIEDKTFAEDFDRSFKGQAEKFDAKRDYDRFREKTMEHTKSIRDRAISPMLPPSGPSSSEFIHRPLLIDSAGTYEKPTRSRSFYNHQIDEYENKIHSTGGYSSLQDPYRVSSPTGSFRQSDSGSNLWTKQRQTTRDHRYDSHHRTTSSNIGSDKYNYGSSGDLGRSSYRSGTGSQADFPDFAPLSSPYEIKSLTENAIKSRHITTYN